MYELKKNGKVFMSKFVGAGPSSYEKRIYQAAVSQRLRNTALCVGEFMVQNPVGMRFFTPIQKVPGAHPVSCTMGAGSFTGVKRPECGIDHPTLHCSEVKERAEIYLYSPSVPSWCVRGRSLLF